VVLQRNTRAWWTVLGRRGLHRCRQELLETTPSPITGFRHRSPVTPEAVLKLVLNLQVGGHTPEKAKPKVCCLLRHAVAGFGVLRLFC